LGKVVRGRRVRKRLSKLICRYATLATPLYGRALKAFELEEGVELAILTTELAHSLQSHGAASSNPTSGYLTARAATIGG